MYIVRFVRKDGKPDEDYFYSSSEEAINHVKLFAKDDSGLYAKIQLIFLEGNKEIVVTEIDFSR